MSKNYFCKQKNTSNHTLAKSWHKKCSFTISDDSEHQLCTQKSLNCIKNNTADTRTYIIDKYPLFFSLPFLDELFQTRGSYPWSFTQLSSVILPVFGYNSRHENEALVKELLPSFYSTLIISLMLLIHILLYVSTLTIHSCYLQESTSKILKRDS